MSAESLTLRGVAASGGIAFGPAHILGGHVVVSARSIRAEETKTEALRLERALTIADAQIGRAQAQLDGVGADEARDILEMHRLILRSSELTHELRELVERQHLSAETATRVAFERLAATFDEMKDPYFRERRSDLEAVSDRVIRVLLGLPELRLGDDAPEGAVAIASDLSPLCPFQLKQAGIQAVVTERGGRTSHAALVARALGLPYVLGVSGAIINIAPGTSVLVDGDLGEVIVRPSESVLRAYQDRKRRERSRAERLRSIRHLPAVTLDGIEIHLAANVESPDEVPPAVEDGAGSVGLFRTELLYLTHDELPSEEEQLADARATLAALGGRPATFRTLDVAPDKLPGGVALPRCPNPALGLRSIRYSLREPQIFRTQLRALYRASAHGPVRIMFPLVSSVSEVERARAHCRGVMEELARDGLPFDPTTPVGIMVETPSAAFTADHLARVCDFFSIGTNDLVQYTFAADRENDEVGYLYRPLHPAVLRAIRQTIEGANAAGIPVSLCGDMASDPGLVSVLVGLGLRSLSMDARHLLPVKAILRATRLDEAERLAAQALLQPSEVEVEELVTSAMALRFPRAFEE